MRDWMRAAVGVMVAGALCACRTVHPAGEPRPAEAPPSSVEPATLEEAFEQLPSYAFGQSEAPLKQIADNSGLDGSVVVDDVRQKGQNIGYDANLDQYVDMFKAGIIDPTKVVKIALSNAASIAGLLLTTEALVTNFDAKEDDKQAVVGSIR